uniref:Uncharacterized protein n=1 Tax=Oryza nivara TaxID=4536 RepID=A0A0E0HWS8_ORYNI
MARAAAATAAAIAPHLVPVIRGATPFSSAVAAAAAAASTPARSSSALTQTLSFPIQATRSAATSTPPWASSALAQPRYFSTRATRGEGQTKIKIGGWEEAYWKLNLRIDHLNAVMRWKKRDNLLKFDNDEAVVEEEADEAGAIAGVAEDGGVRPGARIVVVSDLQLRLRQGQRRNGEEQDRPRYDHRRAVTTNTACCAAHLSLLYRV